MAATEIYCDFDAGNDAGAGTIGDPYKTMQKAHDVIKARADPPPDHVGWGADTTIWLKGTANYEEEVRIEEEAAGGGSGSPLIVEGYTNTPGDGGMATFDGTSSLAVALRLDSGGADNNNYYWHFKNVRWTGYTSISIDGQFSGGHMAQLTFDHCRVDNCPTGITAGAGYRFHDCWFHDCSSYGIEGTWLNSHWEMRCIFENCGIGLHLTSGSNSGAIWNSLFIGNTTNIQDAAGLPIINCVIDGNNKASAIGVEYPAGSSIVVKIFNTIILDCVAGVVGSTLGSEEMSLIMNSCFYLNTGNFSRGAAARSGCIFVDPQFVDRANKDYGIVAASPCKEAGLDLKSYDWYTSTASRIDIGLLQESRTGGSTGGIGAPIGFSVER